MMNLNQTLQKLCHYNRSLLLNTDFILRLFHFIDSLSQLALVHAKFNQIFNMGCNKAIGLSVGLELGIWLEIKELLTNFQCETP
jgi:hypothetical protein